MVLESGQNRRSTDGLVLFAFDDVGLPFQNGVRLHLVPYKSRRDRSRIVVEPGPPGAPDAEGIYQAGTVCRVGDELWIGNRHGHLLGLAAGHPEPVLAPR